MSEGIIVAIIGGAAIIIAAIIGIIGVVIKKNEKDKLKDDHSVKAGRDIINSSNIHNEQK